ncbi:MAG: ABC transporter ATP-binding protein [Magnetococcales bacterium]|nr:ABC transporter ATP-binding protein [Magnetococcales bacterium]
MRLTQRFRHLIPHFKRHKGAFALGFLLLVMSSLTSATIPWLMKLATEDLTQHAPRETLLGHAGLLTVAALLHALLRVTGRTHVFAIGRRVEYGLRKSFHAKLLTLDAPFFQGERTGDLVSRGSGDIMAISMFIGPGFLQISNTLMTYTVLLPIMLKLDPVLTGLALLPFPLILLLARRLTGRLYRSSQAVAKQFGGLSAFVQEGVAGMGVIRSHARQEAWGEQFDSEVEGLYQRQMTHARLQSLLVPLILSSGAVGAWIILARGGPLVANGTLSLGDFVAFTGYLTMLIWPTVGLGWIMTVLQRGLAAMERIGRILDTQPTIQLPDTPPQPIPWQGKLSVRDLHFRYGDQSILEKIHLELPAGGFVGLAGRVGCGKSTLLNCLARLLPPTIGEISIDDRPLPEIDETDLRNHLAMVPQEGFLFSATVRENLLFGNPEGGDELAWEVAKTVCLDEEIRHFPHGLDTLVGERGITLSGGQRQRVTLARALAMNPKVLLLDDIFANVDTHTEARILKNLHALTPQRTILLICHRVSSLKEAETIHLLEEGRLVASGNHDQLLKESPLFQDLHRQMSRQEALEELKQEKIQRERIQQETLNREAQP